MQGHQSRFLVTRQVRQSSPRRTALWKAPLMWQVYCGIPKEQVCYMQPRTALTFCLLSGPHLEWSDTPLCRIILFVCDLLCDSDSPILLGTSNHVVDNVGLFLRLYSPGFLFCLRWKASIQSDLCALSSTFENLSNSTISNTYTLQRHATKCVTLLSQFIWRGQRSVYRGWLFFWFCEFLLLFE